MNPMDTAITPPPAAPQTSDMVLFHVAATASDADFYVWAESIGDVADVVIERARMRQHRPAHREAEEIR